MYEGFMSSITSKRSADGTYYTLGRPVQAWSLLNFP